MTQVSSDFTNLLDAISLLPETEHRSVVAISGFAGSGKSTLAHRLADNLPDSAVVSADDFMLSTYNVKSDSWDCIDRPRIITEILRPAEENSEISFHVYDWARGTATETKNIGTPKVILLEGIGIIHPDLLPYYDFSIWIDVPADEAAERGMNRDREKLHTNNDKLWHEVWMPNDLAYFNKYYPNQLVDFVYKLPDESAL